MFRIWTIVLLLSTALVATAQTSKKQAQSSKKHRDYVPDEKTALQIAKAVLIAQFGEDRVLNHGTLLVDDLYDKDTWYAEVVPPMDSGSSIVSGGGGPAVWINKHSGCILGIIEQTK